jgi:hypothetical protein
MFYRTIENLKKIAQQVYKVPTTFLTFGKFLAVGKLDEVDLCITFHKGGRHLRASEFVFSPDKNDRLSIPM